MRIRSLVLFYSVVFNHLLGGFLLVLLDWSLILFLLLLLLLKDLLDASLFFDEESTDDTCANSFCAEGSTVSTGDTTLSLF